MTPAEFRSVGHDLVDRVSEFLDSLPDMPVTRGEKPSQLQRQLKSRKLPKSGSPTQAIIKEAAELLFDHSLFNGHPRFWGYITSSAAPIGALGDFLASSVNPNVGAWDLSPMATEIEKQTLGWIAEMIRYPPHSGGIFVSGGNMANLVGFWVARTSKAKWDVKKRGLQGGRETPLIYGTKETHAWLLKAADLSGFGTDAIRWVRLDKKSRMVASDLEKKIRNDIRRGRLPFMVVGTAGSVQTGAVDPLSEQAEICKKYGLWFHVDGAYGAFGAVLPELAGAYAGMSRADSIALDPHKWLYAPLEAGCILVKNDKLLHMTFSQHPAYYRFSRAGEEEPTNYYEFGPQNSRGFRALKVWLAFRQVGRSGYERMIRKDIALARRLFEKVGKTRELQQLSQSLSIATFRFVPHGMEPGTKKDETYLNKLNEELLTRLQRSGEVYLSNAVTNGTFALRACIVNFRTTTKDIDALPQIVVRHGRVVDSEMRKKTR